MKRFYLYLFSLFALVFIILGSGQAQLATLDVTVGGGDGPPSTQNLYRDFKAVVLPHIVTDSASGWNATTNSYTIPTTGLYLITSRLRLVDNTTSASFAQGVNTTNTDGPWMVWNQFYGKRATLINARTALLAAGQVVSLYGYCDSYAACNIDSAELDIQQQCTVGICGGGSGTFGGFGSTSSIGGLFTTSVANYNTTPFQTITLANAAAHSLWGNFTSSSGVPGYSTTPVFNGSGLTGLTYSQLSGSLSSTDVVTSIKTLTGCNTSGNVFTPQSSNCVPQTGGGGGTVPTGTGSPVIISGIQQAAAVPMCQSDGTNCFTSNLNNSELFGSQAAGGSDVVAQGPAANHGVILWKNNEWELSNNNDALSRIFRNSDFTSTSVTNLLKTLSGCSTAGYTFSPQDGACVASGGGVSMVVPRDANFHYEIANAASNTFNYVAFFAGNSTGSGSWITAPDATGYQSYNVTTGTTINTAVGQVSDKAILASNPSFRAIFGLDSAAGVQAFIGLCTYCNPSISNSANAGNTAFVGFRHFDTLEPSDWVCIAGNGSNSNTADTGVAVDTAKLHIFDVVYVSGVPQYYIDKARVCNSMATAYLPDSTYEMGASAVWQNTTTTAVVGKIFQLYYGAN